MRRLPAAQTSAARCYCGHVQLRSRLRRIGARGILDLVVERLEPLAALGALVASWLLWVRVRSLDAICRRSARHDGWRVRVCSGGGGKSAKVGLST